MCKRTKFKGLKHNQAIMQLCKIEYNMHKKIQKSKRYAKYKTMQKNTKNAEKAK